MKENRVIDHDDEHNILKFACGRENMFALSIMRPACEKCEKSFKDGLIKGWYRLVDVVPHHDDDGHTDLLKVYQLTPEGIAARNKLNLN